MSASENIAKATALKVEGNEAFKAGDFKKAMVAYHQVRHDTNMIIQPQLDGGATTGHP
jgi:hypothetical protein